MTLEALITKYAGLIHRSSALELKQNPVFMRECRENAEFKSWVASRKPTMSTVRVPVIEFKGLKPVIAPSEAKPSQIEREAVTEKAEEISNTAQIIKDLKVYREKKGFL